MFDKPKTKVYFCVQVYFNVIKKGGFCKGQGILIINQICSDFSVY